MNEEEVRSRDRAALLRLLDSLDESAKNLTAAPDRQAVTA